MNKFIETPEDYKSVLSQMRAEIDALDATIVKAVVARMAISKAIGLIKAEKKAPLFDEAREKQLIERAIGSAVEQGMAEEEARATLTELYAVLLEKSKIYQQREIDHNSK